MPGALLQTPCAWTMSSRDRASLIEQGHKLRLGHAHGTVLDPAVDDERQGADGTEADRVHAETADLPVVPECVPLAFGGRGGGRGGLRPRDERYRGRHQGRGEEE